VVTHVDGQHKNDEVGEGGADDVHVLFAPGLPYRLWNDRPNYLRFICA
jgi:hypothetical protein